LPDGDGYFRDSALAMQLTPRSTSITEGCYSFRRFSDPDEHAQSFANFNQSYVQVEKGPFQSTLMQAELDGVHLFAERANRRIVERAHALPGSIALGWMTQIAGSFGGFSRGGQDWVLKLPSGTELFGVTMQAAEFDRLFEVAGVARTRSRQALIKLSAQALSELRSCVLAIGGHAERLTSAEVCESLREQVLDGILCALGESGSKLPDLTRLTYGDIVKRSQDLVMGNSDRPPTVLGLCTELRVCRRTLQKSFLRVTGRSPSSYLRCMRLGRVRRLLRTVPAAQMTIGDAAARWGFFHLGNFAGDYCRLFDELPSQTLRAGAER
jgi:AraC family transcriptional regulator, ethanolamine operon transcriptional activator